MNTPTIPDPTPVIPAALPDLPAVLPPTVMKQGKAVAKLLKAFIRKAPASVAQIEGSSYPCIEAWQFVAACYEHTPLVVKTETLLSEKGDELGFVAIAHLSNGSGRIVSAAESACMRSENEWTAKPAFQLRSMAQTRACGKVCRNVFAWIMCLAGLSPTPGEEMTGSRDSHSPMTGKKCHECGNQVSDKRWRDSRKKYGKALCFEHEKAEITDREAQIVNKIAEPGFIAESIKAVQERKASQSAGQPIVGLLDGKLEDEYDPATWKRGAR